VGSTPTEHASLCWTHSFLATGEPSATQPGTTECPGRYKALASRVLARRCSGRVCSPGRAHAAPLVSVDLGLDLIYLTLKLADLLFEL
jgi:hypothetical protein